MTAMNFRTALDCSVSIRPMRGYIEKLCLSDKKKSSKGQREGGSEMYMESILVSASAHATLLLDNVLQTPRNDPAQTRRSST